MEHKKLDIRAARLAGEEAGRQADERLIALFAKEGIDDMEHTKSLTCDCHFEEHANLEWESPGFVFCPVHAAASALLSALEGMLAYNQPRAHQTGCPTHSLDVGCTCGSAQARAAILAAKGDK